MNNLSIFLNPKYIHNVNSLIFSLVSDVYLPGIFNTKYKLKLLSLQNADMERQIIPLWVQLDRIFGI